MRLQLATGLIMALAVFAQLLACCTPRDVPGDFVSLSADQQAAAFDKFDFETQFKIYLYEMRQEPADMGYATALAREGKLIINPLTEKLLATEDETRAWEILVVFANMSALDTYDVAADTFLMNQLRTKVGEMKGGPWKNACEGQLRDIEMQGKVPKKFFSMSSDQQMASLAKYDFETQYSIYILGMRMSEERSFLPSAFARGGRSIVQPLRAKLAATKDEMIVRDIVAVFAAMNELGTYDVAKDDSLVADLRAKVSGMKHWKKVSEEQLNQIMTQG